MVRNVAALLSRHSVRVVLFYYGSLAFAVWLRVIVCTSLTFASTTILVAADLSDQNKKLDHAGFWLGQS